MKVFGSPAWICGAWDLGLQKMADTLEQAKILIPMIRKLMPKIIAQDIVGVQPIGPGPKREMTWRDYLNQLQLKYASWTKLRQNCEGDGLADATEMMQDRYPGPYKLVEKYDPDIGTFRLELKFEDDRHKMLWLIKYLDK